MAISSEEMQRRREHVKAAIANSRLEGMTTPSPAELEIFDAYIRGEIDAKDLITAYRSTFLDTASSPKEPTVKNPSRREREPN